jgi:dihydroflavonol-4-reductase
MMLVTGATGHIGNVLVRRLLAAGERVRALIMPGEDTTPLHGLDVELVHGNVLDLDSLHRAMEGVQRVFHLAGIISIMPGNQPLLRRVNVEGTRNVIAAAARAGVRRLLYTSSIHAIQRAPHGTRIDESLPFDSANPVGEYDRSKAQASLAVMEASRSGLDTVIVCPTGVIGPHDYRESELGTLIRDCVADKPQMFVDGAYDFVDVRDVAEGMVLAAENGRAGETYILSGERLTVRRMLDILWSLTGRHFVRIHVPFSLAQCAAAFTPFYYRLSGAKPRFTRYSLDTLRSNSDISHEKATRELGYQPRRILDTMADTVLWFRQRRLAVQA